MQKLAPIVLFVYNRIWHTRQTVKSLAENDLAKESHLIIYSDYARNDKDKESVLQVRNFINTIEGFKSINIIERDSNFGLAVNIISGVSEVIKKYGNVILLEDDIVCSKTFLTYMNKLLSYYESNNAVFSVTGYTFPINIPEDYIYDVYFSPRASSWGWGTWIDRWLKVDWEVRDFHSFIKNPELVKSFNIGGGDLTKMLKEQMQGKIDSWSIKWSYTHFKNNAYCVYPTKSRLRNIGADNSGVHTDKTKKFDVNIFENNSELKLTEEVKLDDRIIGNLQKFFSQNKMRKMVEKISNILSK